jgi:sortase A
MSTAKNSLRLAEWACWLAGFLLFGFFLSQMVLGEVKRVRDIDRVELAWSQTNPDTSLWSPARISAWQESQAAIPANVVAVLAMPRLELEVPVYSGASDLNMDRGAGLIAGTARPGEAGNIGIAGHRDGYFRVLKDANTGDRLTLKTATGERHYRVEEILVVDPLDVEVLDPTDDQRITLVTCYPFYFVGHAPQRYIVVAQLDESLSINEEK